MNKETNESNKSKSKWNNEVTQTLWKNYMLPLLDMGFRLDAFSISSGVLCSPFLVRNVLDGTDPISGYNSGQTTQSGQSEDPLDSRLL